MSKRVGFLFLLLAVIGYVLPWLVNPEVALSPNAYDLAEWSTLHPPTPDTLQPMWIAFLLRLPLPLLAWITVLLFRQYPRILIAIVLILAFAALPPLEYVTVARNNSNYQQQMFVTILVLSGSIIISFLPDKFRAWGVRLVGIVGVMCAVAGIYFGRKLMIGFSLPVEVGAGSTLFVIVMLLISLTKDKNRPKVTQFGLPDDR